MKVNLILLSWGWLFLSPNFATSKPSELGASVPQLIRVAGTINPGTTDYILSHLLEADRLQAPCIILQLDTPGGLLSSTRQIVQAMLATKTPVIVFVSPAGARAGSAGALITFASDVAVMAPGTNIGAAHPVLSGGHDAEKTMNEKITNDTAAFAESLARSKGRNAEWAVKAVRSSESVSADQALKTGVIDFIATDLPDLVIKLSGYSLKAPNLESPKFQNYRPTRR